MAKLLYQGHGSYRIADDGRVLYVDPYAGEGYDKPADIVLITHEHYDHNKLELLTMKPSAILHRSGDMLVNGEYRTVEMDGITVTAVPACNKNHPISECVGYLIRVDGVLIYASGDTSPYRLYGLHGGAGNRLCPAPHRRFLQYGAGGGAMECADLIGAKHTIPRSHMKPGDLYDDDKAKAFTVKSALLVRPGEEISPLILPMELAGNFT